MKSIKRQVLPLLTLLLIVVGAVMPFAASWVQDNRISGLKESLALNSVSLTLQQDADVSVALRLITGDYSIIPWEETTEEDAQKASDAAMEAMTDMEAHGLLPKGIVEAMKGSERWAEPSLLISQDGSSVLVWNCYWSGGSTSPGFILIDDLTGKPVQFLASGPTPQNTEEAYVQLAKWNSFFLDYYGIEIISVQEETQELAYGGPFFHFSFGADLQDSLEPCELELRIYDGMVAFN